jgi:uncharacterized protein YpuA (DUF1002 family)
MMQMTDEQVMTVAVAIIFPVSALIYSNSRVSDVKETMRAEIRTLNADLRSEMAELRGEMKAGFERKQHILEYHK